VAHGTIAASGIQPPNPYAGGAMKFAAILLLGSMSLVNAAMAPDATAQSSQTTAKQDMKDAGHSTANAAKDAGHATKKTTKKVVHKGAQKTDEGSQKVETKTAPQP
jgi:hypothetical protein